MKNTHLLLMGAGVLCIAAGFAGAARQPGAAQSPALFVIKGARVFDGERVHEKADVLVKDGSIAAIGADIASPAGASVIDGAGKTLLPGLIDSHTHAFADALERALVFGVTTELDMFTAPEAATEWRKQQGAAGGAPGRADIFSAGTLVTAPKGHGTEYGMPIPTITSPAEAAPFVDARIAEGSDFIKIVFDDGAGFGLRFPSISLDTLKAVIAAAKARGKMAVVHISSQTSALAALDAGATGLVHIFSNEAPKPEWAARAKASGAFVIPTLTVNESAAGIASGATLADGSPLSRYLSAAEKTALKGSFPARPNSKQQLQHALDATRALFEAGATILAGTDAPNPGTAHGASMHRELELLVRAGLTPTAALIAATSTPARAFGLGDRGRIAAGQRADLVLVAGNPIADITATRHIERVWKGGVSLDRREPVAETIEQAPTTTGVISTFDAAGTEPTAEFGAGWMISTDSLMGGTSTATLTIVRPGAQSAGALEVRGELIAGAPFPWAGAMFYPARTPMMPANLSTFKELVFSVKGDGREYMVMMFATALGNIPASQPFTAGAEWKEIVMPLSAFQGIDGSGLRGVLFSASAPGAFRFAIDNVRLR